MITKAIGDSNQNLRALLDYSEAIADSIDTTLRQLDKPGVIEQLTQQSAGVIAATLELLVDRMIANAAEKSAVVESLMSNMNEAHETSFLALAQLRVAHESWGVKTNAYLSTINDAITFLRAFPVSPQN